MRKIAFYFHTYNTLGHESVLFTLIKGLKEHHGNKVKILLLHDGKESGVFPFRHYAQVYALPEKRQLLDQKRLLINRFFFAKRVLDRFKPQVFVSEYFPFGQGPRGWELLELIRYAKMNLGCRIVASNTYPNCTKHTYKAIADLYDLILLHFPRELYQHYYNYVSAQSIQTLRRLSKDLSHKLFFTGFILDGSGSVGKGKIDHALSKKLKNRKFIVVSRGGRSEKEILITALLVAKRNPDWFFLVSTGPSTTKKEFAQYQKISRGLGNIRLQEIIYPDFEKYLSRADLSINMAGYNTILRLLRLHKKTIAIPSCKNEQKLNAYLANRYLFSRVITAEDLNITTLQREIKRLLKTRPGPKRKVPRQWFCGARKSAQRLVSL